MGAYLSFYPVIRMDTLSPTLGHLSALADPTRSRLLLALERDEVTVGELATILQLPQSTISRHLKVLGDDRWVISRADGTSRYYRLSAELGEQAARIWEVVRGEASRSEVADQDHTRQLAVLSDRRRKSRQYFSSVSERWNAIRKELFGSRIDLELALAMIPRDAVVADLGCGDGSFAALLAPHVGRVIAVDASVEMLKAARGNLTGLTNVDTRQGDLEALPLEDHSADFAVLALSLHYTADPASVLGEVQRILRPGGALIVIDMQPHEQSDLRQSMGHVWPGFAAEQLFSWLAAANFQAIRYAPLVMDPQAKGPPLFLLRAVASPTSFTT